MKKAALLLLPALLAAGPAVPCGATSAFCTCARPESARQALEVEDAVFRGVAVEVAYFVPHPGQTADALPPVRVRVRVAERWKGAPADTVTFYTTLNSGMCPYYFAQGAEYLVYARARPDSVLVTSSCTRTMLTAERGADAELRELRRLTAATP